MELASVWFGKIRNHLFVSVAWWVCRFPFCGFVLERFARGVGLSAWAVSGEAALCGGGVVLSIHHAHRS